MPRIIRQFALVLLACAPVLAPSTARAAVGAADAFGYVWYDNLSTCSTGVSTFGPSAVTVLDRAPNSMLGPVNMGFTMPFYGLPVSQVWISPSGYVTFSAQTSGPPNQTLPDAGQTPNHLIAPFWATCINSDITHEATAGEFHIRWIMTLAVGSDMEFHLWLRPDGTFRMCWQSSWTWPVTVGIENAGGTQGRTCYRDPTSTAGDETRETGFPTPRSRVSACFQPPVLLDCAGATPAACGANIASTLPAADTGPASVYSCTPTAYLGNEKTFQVNVLTPQRLSVSISNPALDLFRIGTAPCSESNCMQLSATDRIDIPIAFAGTYNFAVDKTASGGGDAFNFQVECTPPYTPIDCAGSLAGNTSGGTGVFNTYTCAGPALSGPEALYSFTNPAQQNVAVTLQTAVADLWVVIYDKTTFEAQGACLAAGRGGAGIFDAPAGDYIVVVDGANNAAGAYQIDVDCGQLLDCARQVEIACSDVVSGNTSASPRDVAIYACVSEALTGGEDIYHFYNPIEQTLEARFQMSTPGQRMLLMPDTCNEADCLLTGVNGVSCALFPPGGYFLIIDGTSSGAYRFQLTCSDVFVGVDLRPTSIDATPLRGDCRTFDVAGTTRVAVTNLGDGTVPPPVDVVVFEDSNVDGQYSPGLDNVLGTQAIATPVGPGATVFADVNCAGTVAFRDNVIFAVVDPTNAVLEVNELNNVWDTGRACEYRPPVGPFNPILEWEWTDAAGEVDTVPLVGDVDGDGTPDVVFVAGGAQFAADGVVHCLSGDTGAEIWAATAANALVWSSSNPAMGDIDGDGRPEIIAESGGTAGALVALDDDGSVMWTSQPFQDIPARSNGGGGASIADLNCDGLPEIIWGHNVYDVAGNHFWTPAAGGTRGANGGADAVISVAVDVDGDGSLEVVAGPTCYKYNPLTGIGDILWRNPTVPDGWPAVGNFDDDPAPEIAITASGAVYLLEGDTGALIWQRNIPVAGIGDPNSFCTSTGAAGGPPTIADFDGDCAAEVGVAGSSLYTVLETDGTVKWTAYSNDCSSNRTASSVFDFEGDGAAEVVYMDETYLHILRGTTGAEIPPQQPFDTRIVGLINALDPSTARIRAASHTWTEMISIADVDGDNNAEIIMPMNPSFDDAEPGQPRLNMRGIRVIGDSDDNWVNTRRVWNQHQYHISNVLEDGRIPGPATSGTCEPDSWRLHNTYRDQLGSGIYTAPDITISITRAEVELITCDRQYVIEARVGNGGGIGVGRSFWARFYDPGAAVPEIAAQLIPDLLPGQYQDFQVTIPNPRSGTVTIIAVADDDGTGGSEVSECREDNNDCSVDVTNSPNPIDPPASVGDDVLRATAHSNPYVDPIIGNFNWLLDRGQPRPLTDHFHVYRSQDPTSLAMVMSIEPFTSLTYADSTPLTPLAMLPMVHYYRVVAADECEQEELVEAP